MGIKYSYKTLEDYLVSYPLTVDFRVNDGGGAYFSVKGIELEATILFADITGFSCRTSDLTPMETLVYVNTFFSWITAEAITGKPCIIDKYIGDEIMLLFSRQFGSDDPFIDALQTARFVAEKDVHSYCPHIGIASGPVIAGYVGTPIKYNASLYGKPVTIASRCASIKPQGEYSSTITFPSDLWKYGSLDDIFKPIQKGQNSKINEEPHPWKLLEPREAEIKNIGPLMVREVVNSCIWIPQQSAEERAKECVRILKEKGVCREYKGK
jgi:hypothetical protein